MKGKELATRRSTELSTHVRSIRDLVEEFDEEDLKEQTKSDAENSSFQDRGSLTGNDTLRLCPKRKGAKLLYREANRHWVKDKGDGKGTMIICVAKMKAAGRCYFCEAVAAGLRSVSEKEDPKTYKEIAGQKSRAGAYWNAIDMKAPDRGAKVYWVPFTVHKAIKLQTGIADGDIQERPWDIAEGYPIKITRDDKNQYEVRLLRKKVEELDVECYLGMGDLEAEAVPPTPQELFAYAYRFAENYGVLDDVDWDDVPYMRGGKKKAKKDEDDYDLEPRKSRRFRGDEEEDEDEAPRRRKKTDDDDDVPVRAKAKVQRQEDDDEVEVEVIPPRKKRRDEDDEEEVPRRKRKVVDVEPTKKRKKKEYDASEDEDPFGEDD